MSNGNLDMPFGKHKGTPLRDLPKGYLRWLNENVDLREPLRTAVKKTLGVIAGDAPQPPDSVKLTTLYMELTDVYGRDLDAMVLVNDFYARAKRIFSN